MAQPLTERERGALRFIELFIDRHNFAPSMREIARGIGYRSTSSVSFVLAALETKGRIGRCKDIARGIWIIHEGDK